MRNISYLHDNQLIGTIPTQFGGLEELISLYVLTCIA